jgi:hypothetical protein
LVAKPAVVLQFKGAVGVGHGYDFVWCRNKTSTSFYAP